MEFLLLLLAGALAQPLSLTLMHDAVSSGAQCLDGSPGGYYWREAAHSASSRHYLLALMGGGWCRGLTETSALADCLHRSKTTLGSSSNWASTIEGKGITSNSSGNVFGSWNVAYLYYCDGTSYSGDAREAVAVGNETIYFRGRRILDAFVQHLLTHRGMANAEAVVLTGHSAGGLGVYLHADHIAAQLPKSPAPPAWMPGKLAAVPDAGFFLNHTDMRGVLTYATEMANTFKVSNWSASLLPACRNSLLPHEDDVNCIFPARFARFLRTPLHPIQSQYDTWQLENILALGCKPTSSSGAEKCTSVQLAHLAEYHSALVNGMSENSMFDSDHGGVWTDACFAHTQSFYTEYTDTAWEVPGASGITMAKALQAWWTHKGPSSGWKHHDTVLWPGNKPCHAFYHA